MTKTLIKIDRNGSKHFEGDVKCDRCGGSGIFYVAVHNGHGVPAQPDGGVCYKCHGSGKVHGKWIERTPEYQAELDKKRAEKHQKLFEVQKAANKEKQAEWLLNKGFNEAGETFVVIGDTYSIKEVLKDAGAKFDFEIGWHFPNPVSEFTTVILTKDECFEESGWGILNWKNENFREIIKSRIPKESIQESNFVGQEGDKIQVEVTLIKSFFFDTKFGTSWIHKFKDAAGNIFTWKSLNGLYDVKDGDCIVLKGSIKEHFEYKDEKQTVLTRCKTEKKGTGEQK